MLQREQSPISLWFLYMFLLFILTFIHGQYFHNVNVSTQNNVWIDCSKEKSQSPPAHLIFRNHQISLHFREISCQAVRCN